MTDQTKDIENDAGDEDDDFSVEIVDDVPPEKKPRTPDAKAAKPSDDDDNDDSEPDDEELEGYSEKVRKRLNKLTFKYREAERKGEEASRLREEAIRYAQQVAEENKRLRESVEKGQGAYVEQAKGRAQAELERAKREFKEAYEGGDADALAEAQTKLTKAQAELFRYESFRPQKVQSSVPERDWNAPTQQQPQKPQLTPLQQQWAERNQWFGKNKAMTGFAYGVHEQLVESGVDPNSKTYYDEIDKAVRKHFPDAFGSTDDDDDDDIEVEVTPKKKRANVVAPVSRSTKQPRTIRLTATQAALARRLGLTPEQYAAQMLKEAKNG